MFVPHEPVLSLDVYRNTDRCVCGASSIATYRDGENRGYCPECAKKRENFVKKIIGNIFIGKENSLEYSVLSIVENIRINIFEERINYIINKFYAEQQNSNCTRLNEPYHDKTFIRNLTYEEITMLKNFINSIDVMISNNNSNKINNVFQYYIDELNKRLISARDKVDELNAMLGGYSYTKRK